MLEGGINSSKTEPLQAFYSEKDGASCKALPKLIVIHLGRQSSSGAKLGPQAPDYVRVGLLISKAVLTFFLTTKETGEDKEST